MKTFVQKSFAELFDERGNYIPDDRYREILRLDALLAAQGVPHTCLRCLDGWQVCLPGPGPACRMDAIEHFGSYGAGEDRLELLDRDVTEEPEGFLTAEEACARMAARWADMQRAGAKEGEP